MADAAKSFEDNPDLLKLLIRVRLDLEEDFASSRKNRSQLWDKVLEKVKEKNPNINLSRDYIIRKYLNLMTTYKRIITRRKETGRKSKTWEFFDDFNEVYGNKYSIDQTIHFQSSADENGTHDDSTNHVISTNKIKLEPYDTSIPLNKIKSEADDDSAQPPAIYSNSENGNAMNMKCEPCEDSMELDAVISPEPPAKKICNEILEYIKRESLRKQKRHDDMLAIEKKRLHMQEKKTNVIMELNKVIKIANRFFLQLPNSK